MRKQGVVHPAKWHRMDRQQSILSEHQDDHLDHVAGPVRANHDHLRRIRLRIQIGDDEPVIVGMSDVVVDPVTTSRTMDVHTPIM